MTPEELNRGDVMHAVRLARAAQTGWAVTPIKARLKILRKFRALAAGQAGVLAMLSAKQRNRPEAEVLTAELIPLLGAVQFLERNATRILTPRRLGRAGRPGWLFGVTSEVRREPVGLVLVIGPSNYPLFLPAAQAIQALAAGNAVLVKPGAGGGDVMNAVKDLLHHAGLDHRLLQVLPEDSAAASSAIEAGVEKVILTGSAETGRSVMGQLANKLVPSVMELSGCDAVFVEADADLDLVVRCLRFGTLLNNGATCIAPRRVFVNQAVSTELEGRLAQTFTRAHGSQQTTHLKAEWAELIHEALEGGAHLVSGQLLEGDHCVPPLVLAGALPEMRLLQHDVFAPFLSLITVADDHEAIELARKCPYALGATIFSRNLKQAQRLVDRLDIGSVVINDMIVPTADPRLPFGGRHSSGFGSTRGAEGLLEMTATKSVMWRSRAPMPHLEPAKPGDEALFRDYILTLNSLNWSARLKASWRVLRRILKRNEGWKVSQDQLDHN